MYKKLYAGDEKQKFYSSKLSLTGFESGQIILVAKSNDKIVGYCWIVWYEHIKEKGIAFLEEIYLEENVRGHAIGKAMINKTINLLKDLKIRTQYI
jgi:GNAT superfamily N-acetyltransferase